MARAELKLLVRAFTEAELAEREADLLRVAEIVAGRFPGSGFQIEIKPSYRNMGPRIAEDPKVLDYALEAMRRQAIQPVRRPIRGGTDGSRLSLMGLLTPNLFGGAQSYPFRPRMGQPGMDGRLGGMLPADRAGMGGSLAIRVVGILHRIGALVREYPGIGPVRRAVAGETRHRRALCAISAGVGLVQTSGPRHGREHGRHD